MKARFNLSLPRILIALAIIAAIYGYRHVSERRAEAGPVPQTQVSLPRPAAGGDELIRQAFRERRSNVWVESSGEVERILRDDLEGSRHQRFILRLDSEHTLLISHNIDLAPRIPLSEGDTVSFRGEYEWNERGGVVHWTHHDPDGRRTGGWITHRDRLYR